MEITITLSSLEFECVKEALHRMIYDVCKDNQSAKTNYADALVAILTTAKVVRR